MLDYVWIYEDLLLTVSIWTQYWFYFDWKHALSFLQAMIDIYLDEAKDISNKPNAFITQE